MLAPKTVREITQLPKETQKNGDINKSTRSSADADNGLDAFSGQSRSITMALFLRYSNVEKCRDLEIGVRGHSRSLKVVPFGRSYVVSYKCSLVTLSLKCTVF